MNTAALRVMAVALAVLITTTATAEPAKNVILMISDGLGFNGWEAAKYYQGALPYDNDEFKFYGMTNYMLNTVDPDTGGLVWSKGKDAAVMDWEGVPQGYDAVQYWSDFNYHRGDSGGDYYKFTDSAAAATAMYTGTKTYNSAVSYSVDGKDLPTFAELASAHGKATGAVSSVQFTHATPAAVAAHAYYRYNKTELAGEVVNSDLNVVMGGDSYVSGDAYPGGEAGWKADAVDNGFTVIDDSDLSQWDALADAETPPAKVAGLFSGSTLDGRAAPTLVQMTRAALNVLGQDEDGFHMMVEGGAIDWQNHANNADLMMREQVDFDHSVQAVIDWVEANSSWDDTLLIVTSDHETGGIWGPDTVLDDNGTPDDHTDDLINTVWQNVIDNGQGNLPGMQYTSGGHTNGLVPLWVRGAGAQRFDALIDGNDATAAEFWDQFGGSAGWDGAYVDNTDVFTVMMDASEVPEPASIALLGLGGLAMLTRRRRA